MLSQDLTPFFPSFFPLKKSRKFVWLCSGSGRDNDI